jgi:Pentapeptide repeats (9 copies)
MFEHIVDALEAAATLECDGDPGGAVRAAVDEARQGFSHSVSNLYSTLSQEQGLALGTVSSARLADLLYAELTNPKDEWSKRLVLSPRWESSFTRATMVQCNLSGCDFSRATLRDAHFPSSNLSGTVLRQADLTRANLSGAVLDGADLTGASLMGTTMVNTSLKGATLVDVAYPSLYPKQRCRVSLGEGNRATA